MQTHTLRLFSLLVVATATTLGHAAPIDEIVVRAAPPPFEKSGSYSAHHTVRGRFEGVELVDGVAAARLEFRVRVTNDEGRGFLHGADGHCIGIALYQGTKPVGSGVCSFQDGDGDVLFMRFSEDPYTATGTAESTGGTGKYASIAVEQTHRTLDSDEIENGHFEATGVRTGTWRTIGP